MNQDLPLSTPIATTTPAPPLSDVRNVARASASLPPKPELPTKFREKRRQVWSAARLRPAVTTPSEPPASDASTAGDTQTSTSTWASSSLPTERSEARSLWVELRDDEIFSLEGVEPPGLAHALSGSRPGLARALVWGGAEFTKGANALSLPIGLFVAGVGLILASGVQLFVVLPALLVRHSMVEYAGWVIRHSSFPKRSRSRLAHS